MKVAKSVAGFLLFANFKSQPGCQIQFKMTASKVNSVETNYFFRIAALISSWTLGEWKSWMFTCHRWRQKYKLSGVTSFKKYMMATKNWNQINFISEGVPVDGDDPAHVQWIYDKAKERAESFNIQGVTYRLTQGEEGNIISSESNLKNNMSVNFAMYLLFLSRCGEAYHPSCGIHQCCHCR